MLEYELADARDVTVLRNLIIIALISAAVLALLNAALLRWKNIHHAGEYYQSEKIFSDKLLDMDFAAVDRQSTHDLLSRVQQNHNWGSWGFIRIIRSFDKSIIALMSILGAAALSVSLFTQSVPAKAEDASMGNRHFSFFGFMPRQKERALDIRTYRQDIICDNYASKESVFGPRSEIARYNRAHGAFD